MVDVVVVMVNGKITETGSYEQLIKHDGPFAQFLRQYFMDEPDTEIENEHPDSKWDVNAIQSTDQSGH